MRAGVDARGDLLAAETEEAGVTAAEVDIMEAVVAAGVVVAAVAVA